MAPFVDKDNLGTFFYNFLKNKFIYLINGL